MKLISSDIIDIWNKYWNFSFKSKCAWHPRQRLCLGDTDYKHREMWISFVISSRVPWPL